MIRIVLAAAFFLLPATAGAKGGWTKRIPPPPPPPDESADAPQAPEAPEAPQAPQAPRAPKWPRSRLPGQAGSFLRFDLDIPDLPDPEDFADMDLPGMSFNAFAQAENEDEEQEDSRDERDDDHGVHVYRMRPDRVRVRVPHIRIGRDGDDFDEGAATARAAGKGSATLPIKGPVTFQVRAQGGQIDVVSTDKSQVSISVSGASTDDVALYAFGDRVEPSFRGRRLLRHGKLHVELPRGSRLDVSSMSGDVTVQGVSEARVRTMSGDVKIARVGKSEVQSISGDVEVADSSGPLRLHLVSGHATVTTAGASPQLEFQSASGSLDWGGVCGKDCHLSAETVSGELRLAVDPRSSFELSYTSHSGELRDEVNLAVKRAPRRKFDFMGGMLEGTYGKGEGTIEADAFSGNLVLKKK